MLIENKKYAAATRSLAGLVRALNESELPEFQRLFANVVEESIDLIVLKFSERLTEATGLGTRVQLIERVREEIENLAESLPSRSLCGSSMFEVQSRAILDTYEETKQNVAKTARLLEVTDKTVYNYLRRLGVNRAKKERWEDWKMRNGKSKTDDRQPEV